MGAAAGEQQSPAAAGEGNRPRVHANAPPVLDSQPMWDLKGKISGVKISEKEKREWNTRNIGSRLAVDAMCAVTAGGLVAPIIAMLDK